MSKTVFITGCSSGIGRATALAFAREGAKVVVVDRTPPDLTWTLPDSIDQGQDLPITWSATSSGLIIR